MRQLRAPRAAVPGSQPPGTTFSPAAASRSNCTRRPAGHGRPEPGRPGPGDRRVRLTCGVGGRAGPALRGRLRLNFGHQQPPGGERCRSAGQGAVRRPSWSSPTSRARFSPTVRSRPAGPGRGSWTWIWQRLRRPSFCVTNVVGLGQAGDDAISAALSDTQPGRDDDAQADPDAQNRMISRPGPRRCCNPRPLILGRESAGTDSSALRLAVGGGLYSAGHASAGRCDRTPSDRARRGS